MDLEAFVKQFPFTAGALSVTILVTIPTIASNYSFGRPITNAILSVLTAAAAITRYMHPPVIPAEELEIHRRSMRGLYLVAGLVVAAQLGGQTEWGAQIRHKTLNTLKDEFYSAVEIIKRPERPLLGAARVNHLGMAPGAALGSPSP